MLQFWSFKIYRKDDIMDKEKCLVTSDLAMVKTMLEIAKMIIRSHWTVKFVKILDKSDAGLITQVDEFIWLICDP